MALPPPVPTLLFDYANELRLGILADLPNPPARSFVSMDIPPVDCDQLTVHVPRLEPVPQKVKCATVPRETFIIQWWSCYPWSQPDGQPLLPLAIQNLSAAIYEDGWRLWWAVNKRRYDGTLFGAQTAECDAIILGDMIALRSSGNFAGWQMTVQSKIT